MSRRRELLLLAIFTLLLHAPFLKQPVEGDEVNYLDIAQQVFRQPLTPLNFSYVFQGRMVDAAGHPHPPLNAYILALIWLVRGHFSVVFFHGCYLLFAIAISFAAYALAAWFAGQYAKPPLPDGRCSESELRPLGIAGWLPLWTGLLVAASPLVEVNTNTLAGPEAPALAFLLIGAAAFFWRRFWIAGIALTLAAGTELQALALPPILLLDYLLRRERPPRAAWIAAAAPYLGLAAWQGLQWSVAGRLPGTVLLGYVGGGSALGRLSVRGESALALMEHLGVLMTLVPLAWRRLWGVVPGAVAAALVNGYPWWERGLLVVFVTLGVNALVWLWQSRRVQPTLAAWCLLYFAFAAVVFFAGASRYLLPLVAPAVVLFVLQFQNRTRWLAAALAFNLVLGLNVSFAAYEFSRVSAEVPAPPGRPFLVNGEWGFRYYLLANGGEMLEEHSVPKPPGEWIVSSDLSLGANYDSLAEETAVPLRTLDLTVRTPLRLVDRHAHSGFSSVASGLLSFSFSRLPLDHITYARTSPFLDVPASWTPTEFSGRLVYLGSPRQEVRLPLDVPTKLRFALFAHGKGEAAFSIRGPTGAVLFEKSVPVDGGLWEPHVLPIAEAGGVSLSVNAPPDLQVGWGQLVSDAGGESAASVAEPGELRSYLKLGDVRTKPQLTAGWYPIENGAWRWMAKQGEAVLRPPAGSGARFEMALFFPDGYMQRAGGPVTVTVSVNGKAFARQTYPTAGGYRLQAAAPAGLATSPATVDIRLDRALPPAGAEQRELGAIVSELGFTGGNAGPGNATLAK